MADGFTMVCPELFEFFLITNFSVHQHACMQLTSGFAYGAFAEHKLVADEIHKRP